MATRDGELLEKVFFSFWKKNNNGNLGWGTVGVALSSYPFGIFLGTEQNVHKLCAVSQ
jgi:hypothetical protein